MWRELSVIRGETEVQKMDYFFLAGRVNHKKASFVFLKIQQTLWTEAHFSRKCFTMMPLTIEIPNLHYCVMEENETPPLSAGG